MESSTPPNAEVSITLGVDTHNDAHVAVALDGIGRHRGALSVPATTTGYRRLLGWARGLGLVEQAGRRVRDPSAWDSPASCVPRGLIPAHPAVAHDPRDRAFDGLLANDKFCMIRHARLSLSHSRRPNLTHRQTDVATAGSAYPPAGITRHGGDDETSVAPTSGSDGTPGCEAALGSGVPGHPAVEPRKRASSCSEGEQRGGVP
jgi:hypothetical protein